MTYPWETEQIQYYQNGRSRIHGYGREIREIRYNVIEQKIPDSPRQDWRKGDIVLFNNCLHPPRGKHWHDWFTLPKDQEKFWVKRPSIPYYASKQLAMIVGRYRKVKYKYFRFIDYGIITMMLTGPAAGHIRRWWIKYPFIKKCVYPNNITLKYMLKSIPPEVVDIYNREREGDSNEIRNQLCHEIYSVYHGEN